MQIPSYTMFVGPMFGGKTTRLLSEIDRLKFKKKEVRLFKPIIDDRYDDDSIVSHSGMKHNATTIESGVEIMQSMLDDVDDVDVIAVDEAFMIPGCAEALQYMFSLGKSIIVSSLDLSASCKAFKEIELMMPFATKIIKCPAVCVECGNDAFYTDFIEKLDSHMCNGTEIIVGGDDTYRAVCYNHHSFFSKK